MDIFLFTINMNGSILKSTSLLGIMAALSVVGVGAAFAQPTATQTAVNACVSPSTQTNVPIAVQNSVAINLPIAIAVGSHAHASAEGTNNVNQDIAQKAVNGNFEICAPGIHQIAVPINSGN